MTSILLRNCVSHVTFFICAQAHAKPPRHQLLHPKLDEWLPRSHRKVNPLETDKFNCWEMDWDRIWDGIHHFHSVHSSQPKPRRPRRVTRLIPACKVLDASDTMLTSPDALLSTDAVWISQSINANVLTPGCCCSYIHFNNTFTPLI